MKNRKHLIGSIVTAVTFCAALSLNTLFFPGVLAATPDKEQMKTVSTASLAQTTSSAQPTDSGIVPDVNAVSKEKAIEAAKEGLEPFKYKADFNSLPCRVEYVQGTAPANAPLWVVIFTEVEKDVKLIEPNGANNPKFQGAEIDKDGNAILNLGDITSYYVVDVNALSGKYITHTEYSMGNDPEDKLASMLHEKYGSNLGITK